MHGPVPASNLESTVMLLSSTLWRLPSSFSLCIAVIVIVTASSSATTVNANTNGLKVSAFRGLNNIQEVECSGQNVDPDADLMSMTFFTSKPERVLGVVNHGKRECSTSDVFVLCEVDEKDSRKTRIKALVYDLAPGELREYTCNVSSLKTGGWTKTFSWYITVNSTGFNQFVPAIQSIINRALDASTVDPVVSKPTIHQREI